MTQPSEITFLANDLDQIATFEGRIAVFLSGADGLDLAARRANRLSQGAIDRFAHSKQFDEMKPGQVFSLNFPSGMAAEALDIVKLPRRPECEPARAAGVALGKIRGSQPVLVLAGNNPRTSDIALGIMLRGYHFNDHKTASDSVFDVAATYVMVSNTEEQEAAFHAVRAVAEAVFFTRDLVSEPANVLTTTEFADRLVALGELGLKV